MKAPPEIVCVDCLGSCVMQRHPDTEWEPGDIIAYRCRDCMDVWYIEIDADDAV